MIEKEIRDTITTAEKTLNLVDEIEKAGNTIIDALKAGKKVILAGNGGSAAQAQHIAAEFVVRYDKERGALPSIALNVDTSILTACSNDYSYDDVFSRQIIALGNEGDVLIAISTSGNSPNILKAINICKEKGIKVIGLSGKGGGKMNQCDQILVVPSDVTARIQEMHITIMHIWCKMVDNAY